MKKKIVLISILLIISNSLFGEDFKPKGYLNFDVGTGVILENDTKLNTSVLIKKLLSKLDLKYCSLIITFQ